MHFASLNFALKKEKKCCLEAFSTHAVVVIIPPYPTVVLLLQYSVNLWVFFVSPSYSAVFCPFFLHYGHEYGKRKKRSGFIWQQ